MRLLDDERGQSVQVGAAILLGFVVIAITMYQVEVVSSQNAEVEFNHDEEIREDLTELRNSINNAGTQGESDSTAVKLGGQYPPRTIFVNPPPIQGALQTQEAGNISFGNVQVQDPGSYEGSGNPSDLVSTNHTTKRLVYVPRYFELDDAGVTTIEHSLAFKAFENNATDPISPQQVVKGDSLTLTVLQGNLSEQGTQSVSLDPETVSGPTDPITITNASAGPIELYLPTEMPSVWNETIGTEFGDNDARVAGYDGQLVTIELDKNEYQLWMALVDMGDGVADSDRYDVAASEDGGGSTGGSTYDLSWDTEAIDQETGISCGTDSCTYSLGQSRAPFTVNTSPEVSGADIDYSVEYTENGNVAYFDPNDGETGVSGENVTEMVRNGASDGDRVYVHANSGADGDRIAVDFVSTDYFAVTITNTNSPVTQGENLTVDVTIENTGDSEGTQTIEFAFDGKTTATRTISLNSSESQSVTFEYNTSEESPGTYLIEVASDDESDTQDVEVVDPSADGTISGTVQDANTGSALENVDITIYESGTTNVVATDTSNATGEYSVDVPSDTTYDVEADGSATGYEVSTRNNVAVDPGASTTVDFQLRPITVFATSNDWQDNNKDIDTNFDVSDGSSTVSFSVYINQNGQTIDDKEVSIEGTAYVLTNQAATDLSDGINVDLLDASNYHSISQSELNQYRQQINPDSAVQSLSQTGSYTLDINTSPK